MCNDVYMYIYIYHLQHIRLFKWRKSVTTIPFLWGIIPANICYVDLEKLHEDYSYVYKTWLT